MNESVNEGVEDGLHDDAIASLRRRCVWVLSLAHRSPYRRDQMVLCGFAVSDKAVCGFAHSDAWSCEVVPEPLVVLCEPTELEL